MSIHSAYSSDDKDGYNSEDGKRAFFSLLAVSEGSRHLEDVVFVEIDMQTLNEK